MDCFIIRVYRHITQGNGEPGEIAGLVERVGRQDNGKPFSSYKSLVSALREEFHSDAAKPEDDSSHLKAVSVAKRS